jgi:type IV secretory pathway TrbD component
MVFLGALGLLSGIMGGALDLWYAGYVAGFGLVVLLLGLWRLRKIP